MTISRRGLARGVKAVGILLGIALLGLLLHGVPYIPLVSPERAQMVKDFWTMSVSELKVWQLVLIISLISVVTRD